ncbi:hypothetical protein [Brevibacillus choshinensis]|uniref:Uncharacterized protein n=1 Tax=Brevibacillus choshinensis TaxID=54911 RepID=A0ABX7FRE8_BRECH|nr:hypothetical protein [Brevibacillus choshinensis]QRG68303.1 hypothetical protein JNE38_03765 [Brevibacillus choshinensis]
MAWSHKDSLNLERVAVALEKLVEAVSGNKFSAPVGAEQPAGFSVESEFFRKIAEVYAEEEELKQEKNLKRKSGVRLSHNVTAAVRSFFQGALSENGMDVTNEGPLLFVYKGQEATACIRFYADLGFHRGDHFYGEIEKVVHQAASRGVSNKDVFVIVSSLVNSIDGSHVKQLMGENVPDTASLLTLSYRSLLQEYIELYVNNISSLANPIRQVFFLSAENHPNVAGWNFVTNRKPIPQDIMWLRPSITELLSKLKSY